MILRHMLNQSTALDRLFQALADPARRHRDHRHHPRRQRLVLVQARLAALGLFAVVVEVVTA